MHTPLKQPVTTSSPSHVIQIHEPSATTIKRVLAVILLLAVLVRIGSALFQGETVEILPGVYDQVSYDGSEPSST